MTESWKREEGDSKSTPGLVLSSVQGTAPYGKYEIGTLRSQWSWQKDHHVYVRNAAQENMKHRPELQSHTVNRRRPTRSGVRRYRWSHRNTPRAPMEPNAWGDAPPHKRNTHQWRKPSAKTQCKRGDNATGSINETDAKKWLRARSGHSQRVSAKPTAEADKATTKKERGMEWVSDSDRASNWGTNARKVRDPWRGRTKQRGKNSRRLAAAGRTTASASAATGRQEKRQAEAEASPEGEGSKPKKQTSWQEAEQSRWTWKRIYGQGSTTERTKNLPRPAAPVRTTRQEGASGCRAQAEPPTEIQNHRWQKVGQGTQDNPRPAARVEEATLNPNMGQWRTLEGAKDNLSSSTH